MILPNGLQLGELRRELGLTKVALANELKLSPNVIDKAERGNSIGAKPFFILRKWVDEQIDRSNEECLVF